MTASFPTGTVSYTSKTDGIDYVMAEHMNSVQDEIVAIEDTFINSLYKITYPVLVTTIHFFLTGTSTPNYVHYVPLGEFGEDYTYDPTNRLITGSAGYAEYIVPISGAYNIAINGGVVWQVAPPTEERYYWTIAVNDVVYTDILYYTSFGKLEEFSSGVKLVSGLNAGDALTLYFRTSWDTAATFVVNANLSIYRVG